MVEPAERLDASIDITAIRGVVGTVCDPEIPILTIEDLGVLRDINIDRNEIVVTITPTYVGCPAMDTISSDIKQVLAAHGYESVKVELVMSPAWTTDWLSAHAREKLLAEGIAPPNGVVKTKKELLGIDRPRKCPKCGSKDTECVSEFGSTACKALYRCRSCLEPFDYFKCI
ncbi:MAG: 1,2-phenylacetyl-CoA epoxidase subunit PaaD [Pseudomonadota bacterium]